MHNKRGRAIPALANRPEARRELSLNPRASEWGPGEPRHRREIRTDLHQGRMSSTATWPTIVPSRTTGTC
jgi:hypothetical protein